MRKRGNLIAAALVAFGALGLASCAADPSNIAGADNADVVSNNIHGSVFEWGVDVSAHKAEAGQVKFAIANYGSIPHEFIVVKTDFEPGKIPLGENNRFDEEGEGLAAIDEIKEFPVDSAEVLSVDLEPGKYQLLCNIEGHYKNGMYTAFEVIEGEGGGATDNTMHNEEGDSETVSNDVSGSVKEWAVEVDATAAEAGDVSFTIKNNGAIPHEFIVVKTDYELGKIPLGENNRFDEEGEGLTAVGEIKEWDPGTTGKVTLKLEPGKYQLLCNIAGHYKNGMYTGFTVG